MQLIQIFLNPFISSLFLCKLVQLFCFLLSFWDQSGSFTFLSFLISSRWILIFFPSSFPLLSVRKGSPAQVFVWWWDRLCRFCSFFFFFTFFFCPSSLRVFARPALPLPSLFHFFFLLCRDALGVVYGNFCWIFPNSYNILAFPSSGSATKTI